MGKIYVDPSKLRQFRDSAGAAFCLVTNRDVANAFEVRRTGSYDDYHVLTYDTREELIALLENGAIPRRAHVLVASPASFFRSPDPQSLGGERKMMVMACNSTPTPLPAIAHFLRVIEDTDPDAQDAFAERFFEVGQSAESLAMVDEGNGTAAVFEHLDESYEWNQQAGSIGWGEQQIAPAGEISVLPMDIERFDPSLRLSVDGELAIHGYPILHSGTPSFLRADQERIYRALAPIRDHALVATVRGGEIVTIRATHPAVEPARLMLEAMFAIDSRYRILWEIGFAVNVTHTILRGNYAMNEVYGGTNGAVHLGLGLTPYTQYHLDIICPNLRVYAGKELLLGSPRVEGVREVSLEEAVRAVA